MLTTHLRSDGRHKRSSIVDGGPSTQTVGHLRMEGSEVFKHAVGMITDVIVDSFKATGATRRASTGSCRTRPTSASSMRRRTNSHIAPQKVVLTVDLHGNTSAASIPLALSVAVADGRIKRAIWCYWKRWAAVSRGDRHCCAGKHDIEKSLQSHDLPCDWSDEHVDRGR